jgi:hypothetical protein
VQKRIAVRRVALAFAFTLDTVRFEQLVERDVHALPWCLELVADLFS